MGFKTKHLQRLFKRIHKMQEKAEQRRRCRQEKQEKKEEAAGTATGTGVPPPPPPFFGRGRGMFRGCGRGGMGGMGGMGMGGMGAGRGGMGGRGGQWNWQWPGAAGAWAGPTFEAMMQGWMGEQPGQPGGAAPGAAGDHQEAHARRKPLPPMPMHLLTLLLRQQPRMLTMLLMLLLKLLRQHRELLLLLACLREVERNTCRGLGTLWLLRSILLASTCRWMSRLQEGRGPLSSRLPRPTRQRRTSKTRLQVLNQ